MVKILTGTLATLACYKFSYSSDRREYGYPRGNDGRCGFSHGGWDYSRDGNYGLTVDDKLAREFVASYLYSNGDCSL